MRGKQSEPVNRRLVGAHVIAALVLGTIIATPSGAAAATAETSLPAQPFAPQADAGATPDAREVTACLQRSWLHSHEEDTPEIVVYRPDDFVFPPSRGRIGFEFLSGGYLVYRGIAPGDGPIFSHGRWEQTSPGIIEIEIDEPDQPVARETLEIVSCSSERLEVAR